jgi:hypothetical protein
MDPITLGNTKKKISMIGVVLPHLLRAKGVANSDLATQTQASFDECKAAWDSEKFDEAREIAKSTVKLIEKCVEELPKIPRKRIRPRIQQLARY